MELRELTNEEFINFTNKFNLKSIYQTPEYGYIMENQGYKKILLGLIDNNKILAASLILIGKENGFKYAYAPKGFLINYNDYNLLNTFSKYLKKYLSKLQIVSIKISPLLIKNIYNSSETHENPFYEYTFIRINMNKYYHLGYDNLFETLTPRFEAVINLNKPIDILFKNIKKEYKTKIKTCIKNGIKVYKGNLNDIEKLENFTNKKYEFSSSYFKDCYNYYSKRGMADLYYTKIDTNKYLKNIQERLESYQEKSDKLNEEIMRLSRNNPENLIKKRINIDKYVEQYQNDLVYATEMLKNNPDGIITAAILTIKQDKNVTILIDSYDKRFKKLNSKHLLIWQLIEIYHKQGFEKFNLGGISNLTDENTYSGLNEFKVGFGANIYEYAGDFEFIANRKNYEISRSLLPLSKQKNKLFY